MTADGSKNQASEASEPPHDDDSEDEVDADQTEYDFYKCGKATVDAAVAAVSRWHSVKNIGHEHEIDKDNKDDIDEDEPELAFCDQCFLSFDSMELVLAVIIYWVTLAVQCVLIFFFYTYWVEFREDPWEEEYQAGIRMSLENATILKSSLATVGTFQASQALLQCQANRSPPFVHLMCLWLWFGVAMNITFESLHRFYIVLMMEHAPTGANAAKHRKEPSLDPPPSEKQIKVNIQYMSRMEKAFAIVFLLLPNFFFSLFIGWVGIKYVTVTTQVNLLVKASLKMNFIARMDKIVYPCLVSYNWENYISASQFKVKSNNYLGDKSWCGWIANQWPSTLLKTILGLYVGYVVANDDYFWPQIEEYRLLCKNYFSLFPNENVNLIGMPPPPVAFSNDDPWYPNI